MRGEAEAVKGFLKSSPFFCALLLFALLLVYRGELSKPLESDARYLAYANDFVLAPGGLARIWVSDFFAGGQTQSGIPQISGYYRPVTNTLFWLEYRIAGRNDTIYRLDQLLLHWLNSCLLFFLSLRLFGSRLISCIAALLFALHPINAYVATQASSRADVLFFTFYLCAMWSYSAAILSGSGRRLRVGVAAAVLFYLLAIMSKEMGATLPMELCLLHIYFYYGYGISLKRVVWTAPLWAAFGLYFVWRFLILDIWPQDMGYSTLFPAIVLYLNLLKNISIYVLRILLPHGADYPELFPTMVNYIDPALKDPLIYLSILLVAAMAVGAVVLRKREPGPAFLMAFFLVTMTPLIGVNNISGSLGLDKILAQERWVYLPSISIYMLLGFLFSRLYERVAVNRSRRNLAVIAALAVLVSLGRMSAVHAANVNSELAVLKQYYLFPEERLGRLDRVNKLILYSTLVALPLGHIDEAEKRCRKAVATVPDSPLPAVALSRILAERGKWGEVVETVRKWVKPSREQVVEMHGTNFRVVDDIHRTEGRVAYFFGRGLAHTGMGGESMAALCESLRRGYNESEIAPAIRESYALNGPPHCLEARDVDACIAEAPDPGFPEWNKPLDPVTCGSWPGRLADRRPVLPEP